MPRVLVTGAAGFLGRALIAELAGDHSVVGADVAGPPAGREVDWLRVADEASGLAEAVGRSSPELLVHAAFVNRRPADWSAEEYLARQLVTNLRLFERCARLRLRVILVSSSAVYGAATGALDEDTPRRPVSLYGLAKTVQEAVAEQATAAGVELCTVRLFNLVGPGQPPGQVVADWVAQIAAIAGGAEPVLRVRNRATRRDFVDVRDAARAIGLLARGFRAGVFNVASGRAVGLGELSDLLAGLSPVAYRVVETDERGPGTDDAPSQRGDARRLRAACGWQPEIDWRQSVRDFWSEYHARGAG